MSLGYKIFPKGKKYNENFDRIFNHVDPFNPCKGCRFDDSGECLYDGDCIVLEKENANG